MADRPVLTARWTELLMLNFAAPIEAIAPLVPPGTEPDLHDGQACISVIGFRFHAVRLYGMAVPGHTDFPEINLRYYVRRHVGNEVRRGVVFVREIVPRRAVSFAANWLYNENYITRPMQTTRQILGASLAANDTIEYAWRSHADSAAREMADADGMTQASVRSRWFDQGRRGHQWNRLAGRVSTALATPPTGSFEQFIVERYWGYALGRDGATREYQVAHVPWRVAPADNIVWDCDLPATYNTPFVEYLREPPVSAIVADGSAIKVFRGRKVSC